VSRTETWQLRKESDVYILNSTYEGLPHTVLTSFAAGIPLVATNISGTNEAVVHEVNGLLIPPNNSVALAEAVIRLFENPALGEQLVQGGHTTLAQKFSWEAHLRELTSLLSLPR
jgi:glycosyltransferase involved in cell wall biosynthesis